MSGAIRRSHESKKRVRSATAFGQCNRNRLLGQSKILFAHLTPGPLVGVSDLQPDVERLFVGRQHAFIPVAGKQPLKTPIVSSGNKLAELALALLWKVSGDDAYADKVIWSRIPFQTMKSN
ncbi:hypothetical protein [Paraburkholderia youngii]|uniref:hypothetical protein n=1 Tax=Paraburkholderia youngii TaxID=2782701 RepID=UPI003D236CDB